MKQVDTEYRQQYEDIIADILKRLSAQLQGCGENQPDCRRCHATKSRLNPWYVAVHLIQSCRDQHKNSSGETHRDGGNKRSEPTAQTFTNEHGHVGGVKPRK